MRPLPIVFYYVLNRCGLEVVVETEGQVVAIEVETEGVCSLSSIYVKLVILVTEETEVSNEAELVVEVNSNTGLYTYTERIALQTISISMSIVNSTVNEYVNLVELNESVTSIGSNLENLVLNLYTVNLGLVLTVTESDTYCPVLVEIVTNLRKDLDGSLAITIVRAGLETNTATNVNLSVCSHSHHCNKCNSKNLFHNLFTYFFNYTLVHFRAPLS